MRAKIVIFPTLVVAAGSVGVPKWVPLATFTLLVQQGTAVTRGCCAGEFTKATATCTAATRDSSSPLLYLRVLADNSCAGEFYL